MLGVYESSNGMYIATNDIPNVRDLITDMPNI